MILRPKLELYLEDLSKKFYCPLCFQCQPLFQNSIFDATSDKDKPPREIPEVLLDEFTYHGRVKVKNEYYDGTNENHPKWTKKLFDEYDQKILENFEGRAKM